MEVTQTQRNSLTGYADGERSETIILLRLYSPTRSESNLIQKKYYESNGIVDSGTVIQVLQEFMVKLVIMKPKMQKLKIE